jgi:hypothetical protein
MVSRYTITAFMALEMDSVKPYATLPRCPNLFTLPKTKTKTKFLHGSQGQDQYQFIYLHRYLNRKRSLHVNLHRLEILILIKEKGKNYPPQLLYFFVKNVPGHVSNNIPN